MGIFLHVYKDPKSVNIYIRHIVSNLFHPFNICHGGMLFCWSKGIFCLVANLYTLYLNFSNYNEGLV